MTEFFMSALLSIFTVRKRLKAAPAPKHGTSALKPSHFGRQKTNQLLIITRLSTNGCNHPTQSLLCLGESILSITVNPDQFAATIWQ